MRRRSFINKSLAGVAGLTIASLPFVQLLVSCSKAGKDVTLALLGCDESGISIITDGLKGVEKVKIKTVYGQTESDATEAANAISDFLGYMPGISCDISTIFEDKDIDGVVISLPEESRFLATKKACLAGKDVYVEGWQPQSIREGEQIAETIRKNKNIVQCGFILRSSRSVLEAKKYIEEGKLGQVVHIKALSLQDANGRTPDIPVSNLMSRGIRELDLARFLVGDPGNPASIYICGTSPNGGYNIAPERMSATYDYDKFTLSAEAGGAYNYMVPGDVAGIFQWLLQPNRVEVYGTEGVMYANSDDGRWQVIGNGGKTLAQGTGEATSTAHIRNFVECCRSRYLPNSDIGQAHLGFILAHLSDIAYKAGNKQLLYDNEKGIYKNTDINIE